MDAILFCFTSSCYVAFDFILVHSLTFSLESLSCDFFNESSYNNDFEVLETEFFETTSDFHALSTHFFVTVESIFSYL